MNDIWNTPLDDAGRTPAYYRDLAAKQLETLGDLRRKVQELTDDNDELTGALRYVSTALDTQTVRKIAAEDQAEAAEKGAALIRETLRSLEWSDVDEEGSYCPICGNADYKGHEDGCEVKAALSTDTGAKTLVELNDMAVRLNKTERERDTVQKMYLDTVGAYETLRLALKGVEFCPGYRNADECPECGQWKIHTDECQMGKALSGPIA